MSKATAYALIAVLAMSIGCTTRYFMRSTELPKSSKVGVLLVDDDGGRGGFSMKENYVFNSLIEHGVVPISLNLADVRPFYDIYLEAYGHGETTIQKDFPADHPLVFERIKEYLAGNGVQYVLVLHIRAKALDETLHATVVRVSDMAVIGSKYYEYRATAAACAGPFFVGWFYCGFLYLKNTDPVKYHLVDELLDELMGVRRL